jgi:hypothetical protein
MFAAAPDPCRGAIFRVNCDNVGGGIFAILDIVLNILTAGVIVAAIAGIIFAALRYSQSRDNAESVAGAKKMIFNIMIGLAIWAVFRLFLWWLLPGDNVVVPGAP